MLRTRPLDTEGWPATGDEQSSISRIWRAFGCSHRSRVSLSQDPQLIEKVRDIVGLYMEPPVNAVVLCVDEKGQIQALARSQPLLPMRPGQVERRTHDYMRHGTTSLFAALEVATGNVLTKCYRRHRSVEFRDFLDQIDAAVPQEREVHIVLDNYATHKTALVVAGWQTAALPPALYTNPQFEDQSGRTLVCPTQSKADQARQSSLGQTTPGGHRNIC